jgi:hypothetical protein
VGSILQYDGGWLCPIPWYRIATTQSCYQEMMNEIDYKTEYQRIAHEVGKQFPECEVTTLDMIKLLIHENNTLRMALKIPIARNVIWRIETGSNE